jgi:hypothetical protein
MTTLSNMTTFNIGDRVELIIRKQLGPGTVTEAPPERKSWGPTKGIWVLWDNAIDRLPTWVHDWEIQPLDNSSQK